MSYGTALVLCYFNCCYFEEWCFSTFCQGCPQRTDEFWIIYHLCGNMLSVWNGGMRWTVRLHSCYGNSLIGDGWWGIFHHASTSSRTPALGFPLSPVHGALDEYDWLITPAGGSPPDGLMCFVWVGQTLLCCEMRDECVQIWSCAVCTSLIIIFLDEYHRRQDDEVAIFVQRLSQANTEQAVCHCWEI